MFGYSNSANTNKRAGVKPAPTNTDSNDFYPGYGYYTKTGLAVNTIKNGLPQIREAVSINMN
jgi:hypothetical protein